MVATKRVKVADQVWIAVVLLTQEHPDQAAFTTSEIVERVRLEFGEVLPGIQTHISQHCVASKRPNPGRLRMLSEADAHKHRLFRPGDPYHPDREGSKTRPDQTEVPVKYHPLLDWYETDYSFPLKLFGPDAPLLGVQANSGSRDTSQDHDRYLAEATQNEPANGGGAHAP